MTKPTYPRQIASKIRPGTIITPFIGDGRFDVAKAETSPEGETKFTNWQGDVVRMDADNRVEILGFFNL